MATTSAVISLRRTRLVMRLASSTRAAQPLRVPCGASSAFASASSLLGCFNWKGLASASPICFSSFRRTIHTKALPNAHLRASSFHHHRVAPEAVHLRDVFPPAYLPEAADVA